MTRLQRRTQHLPLCLLLARGGAGGAGRHWRSAIKCVVDQFQLQGAKKAGREVRLVLVRLAVRALLQVEFLSGPRTENSTDLSAIDRALI